MPNQPLVSVVIGTYNGSKWIIRAVDSMLNQTYTNIEIIICDDCSTDNTYSLLQNQYGTNNRVKLVQNEQNLGLNHTLNHCIDVANGTYIARMDDDDYSHPDRIAKQVEFLNNHPEYVLVSTSNNYFDETGIWGNNSAGGERSKIDIFLGRSFVHPTVVMRKDALLEVGKYSTDKLNRRGQDYDLWCKFYEAGYKGYVLPDILFDYYESKDSVKRRKVKYRFNQFIKVYKWRRRLHLPFKYDYFTALTLLKCFIPQSIVRLIHAKRFKK